MVWMFPTLLPLQQLPPTDICSCANEPEAISIHIHHLHVLQLQEGSSLVTTSSGQANLKYE